MTMDYPTVHCGAPPVQLTGDLCFCAVLLESASERRAVAHEILLERIRRGQKPVALFLDLLQPRLVSLEITPKILDDIPLSLAFLLGESELGLVADQVLLLALGDPGESVTLLLGLAQALLVPLQVRLKLDHESQKVFDFDYV